MGRRCCVVGCENSRFPTTVVHVFPTNPLSKKRWLDAIEKTHGKLGVNADNFGICSNHFTASSYSKFNTKRLLKSAIPHILGNNDELASNSSQFYTCNDAQFTGVEPVTSQHSIEQ